MTRKGSINDTNLRPRLYLPIRIPISFQKPKCATIARGACVFEARNAIEPGSDLYIMMEDFSPDAIDVESYDGYRAEVRWCRKITLDNNRKFIVGVKYYKTIIK